MTSCAKDNIEDAIKFIKEHVYIKRSDNGEKPVIYTTGVGCNQMTERFNKEFDIRYITHVSILEKSIINFADLLRIYYISISIMQIILYLHDTKSSLI